MSPRSLPKLIVPIFFFTLLQTAQPQTATAAKPAASAPGANYSDQPFIYEKAVTQIRRENDGTGATSFAVRARVISEAGVQALGLLSFPYDNFAESVQVESVRVFKADGTVVSASLENAQDIPSAITREAPMYSDNRERHIPVPNLRPGDSVEYKYTRILKSPPIPGQFWVDASFLKESIVLDEEMDIDLPADREVKFKTGTGIVPSVSTAGGRKVYRLRSKNLTVENEQEKSKRPKAAAIPEEKIPDVELSSFLTWKALADWYYPLQHEKAEPTKEVAAKAQELVAKASSQRDKIAAIYNYVAHEYRYIGLSFGIGRFVPHAAGTVFENHFGDCKDKHTLLQAMLSSAGIKSSPVLIGAGIAFDPDVPSPAMFNHLITAVETSQGRVWLDSTTEVAPYGYLLSLLRGKKALLSSGDASAGLVDVPAEPPFPVTHTVHIEGAVNELGKFDATIEQVSRGDMEVLFRQAFLRTPQQKWQQLAQAMSFLAGYGGEVSDVTASDPLNTDEPFKVKYHYTKENYASWEGTDGTVRLPLPIFGIPEPPEGAAVKAFKLGTEGEYVQQGTLKLPPNVVPYLPPAVVHHTPFLDYSSSYRLTPQGVVMERRLTTKQREVQPSQSADYATLYRDIQNDYETDVRVRRQSMSLSQVPTGSSVKEMMASADNAFRERQFSTAERLYAEIVRQEPKHPTAWTSLAQTKMFLNKPDEGLEAVKKEIEVNPQSDTAYLLLADVLAWRGDRLGAIAAYKKQQEIIPQDPRARLGLIKMYNQNKDYKDAIPLMEQAVADNPNDASLQGSLGHVYLEIGNTAKALEHFDQTLKLSNEAGDYNNIAYQLAQKKIELDRDEAYAKKALSMIGAELSGVHLDQISFKQIASVNSQAAYWDTLGYVYLMKDEAAKALPYLEAAWTTYQNRTVAEHLADAYEKTGMKAKAMAIKSLTPGLETLEPHPVGPNQPPTRFLFDRKSNAAAMRLQELRTMRLPNPSKSSVGLEFFVSILPGDKVDEVKFMRNDAGTQAWENRLKKLKFPAQFPDSTSTKIIRRGVLSCSSFSGHCMVVLTPPDTLQTLN